MARSLSRNTRLIVSTLAPSGLTAAAADTTNTFEVKVLDGYSFSQDTTTQEIGVNEAGTTPVRGTLGFNTALNPVDVSFSTYVRPYRDTIVNATEMPLWVCAMGTDLVTGAGHAIESQDASALVLGLDDSNHNELLKLYLYFVLENTTYVIENFSVNTAEVDFSIDGISQINWSGSGTNVYESEDTHNKFTDTGHANYLTEGTDYKAVPTTTSASFLRNKLSTLELKDNSVDATPTIDNNAIISITSQTITLTGTYTQAQLDVLIGGRIVNNNVLASEDTPKYATIVSAVGDAGIDLNTVTVSAADNINGGTNPWVATDTVDIFAPSEHAGVVYNIPITGATLSLENNFSYLTPEELAIVNEPLAGFAGNRAITGSLTAYLNTGAEGSAGLLADLLQKKTEVSNNFELIFHMGGGSTATQRVDFTIANAQIAMPTTSVEDIISTEISFTGKPWSVANNEASFEDTNELTITYVSDNDV